MQPLPPRINEKEPELNDTIVFFAVAMVNQMKTLWRFLPPTVSESTMAVLHQVADLSHQMSSDVLTAFCAVVNRYLRAYLPGSALIESGYTMKLLMMQPSGNNMLAFHSDAARHLKDVREIGSIFARNDKPGKLCFFHCERNHWVLFVVNTADKTFKTYNSARSARIEPTFRGDFCTRMTTVFRQWGYLGATEDLQNIEVRTNPEQDESDLINCGYYTVYNSLHSILPNFALETVHPVVMRAAVLFTVMFEQLPLQ
jgi:hypothetical protein